MVVDDSSGTHLANVSSLSGTVLPSTPESPGEMFVLPLGSESSTRQVTGKASPRLSGISKRVKTPKQRQSVDLSGISRLWR